MLKATDYHFYPTATTEPYSIVNTEHTKSGVCWLQSFTVSASIIVYIWVPVKGTESFRTTKAVFSFAQITNSNIQQKSTEYKVFV